MSPYHPFFALIQTQDEYKKKLDVFLNKERVEDMRQSAHALRVTFSLKNIDVFAEM